MVLNYTIAFLNLFIFKDLSELSRAKLGGVGDEGDIIGYAGVIPSLPSLD